MYIHIEYILLCILTLLMVVLFNLREVRTRMIEEIDTLSLLKRSRTAKWASQRPLARGICNRQMVLDPFT